MANLSPYVFNQYFDDDGEPLSGGLIYSYKAGTALTMPKNTFTSPDGLVAHPNPVVLDASGREAVYLEEGSYDFVIKDALGVTIDDRYGVFGGGTGENSSLQTISNIVDLKNLASGSSSYIDLGGYYVNGDGGGGRFYWDSTSVLDDNGGTVIAAIAPPGTGRWIRIYDGAINVKWFGAVGDGATDDQIPITTAISALAATGGDVYFDAGTYRITAAVTVPDGVRVLRNVKAMVTSTGAVNFTCIGILQDVPSQFFAGAVVAVLNPRSTSFTRPEWFGGKADDSTDNAAPITKAVTSFAGGPLGVVKLGRGTYKVASPLAFSSTYNGIRFEGATMYDTILKFYLTSSQDGITFYANHNGLVMQHMRLTCDNTLKGRDGLVFRTTPDAYPEPDAGTFRLSNLDIRNWGRHGIVHGLTVDTRSDLLQVVHNGGNGILFPQLTVKATTWQDTGSWFNTNGGHGIVLDGPTSVTLSGTITDSNYANKTTGVAPFGSTDLEVIKYAGYTLLCSAFPVDGSGYVGFHFSDVNNNLSVQRTRGGISTTIGTLAHYDNVSLELVINCTLAGGLAHVAGDTYQILSGTSGSATAASVQKNSHGLYARNTSGLNWQGGHTENHIYGAFISGIDMVIMPGKVLTQGANAWGIYLAAASSRILIGGFSADVQATGAGDIYIGPDTRSIVMLNGHGAYTFTNRSHDAFILTGENAAGMTLRFNSTDESPMHIDGHHANQTVCLISNRNIAGGRSALQLITIDKSRILYLDNSTGNMVFESSGMATHQEYRSAGVGRTDQRIILAQSDGSITWSYGATVGIMTGVAVPGGDGSNSLVEADFTIDAHDDSGTKIDTYLMMSRANRWIQIPAGKGFYLGTVPCVTKTDSAPVPSVDATETGLWSELIPANTLARNGDGLRSIWSGTTGLNGNNKRFKFKYDGTECFNSGNIAFNNSNWKMVADVQRTGANTLWVAVSFFSDNALLYSITQCIDVISDTATSVTMEATGQGTVTADVVCRMVKVEYLPAP